MFKKIISAVLVILSCLSVSVMFTGCDGDSDDNGKNLYDADAWDYDGDGKLNRNEMEDYNDFNQDMRDAGYY
ncbi:MAG: hypothetical protein J5994_08370 [Ruminococcus sp.]|nr:hypothetical protein [Ruminococcus sp.]